jgi:hypothetical protein
MAVRYSRLSADKGASATSVSFKCRHCSIGPVPGSRSSLSTPTMVTASVAPFLSSSVTVEPNVTLFDGASEAPGLCENSSIPSQRDYDAVVMPNPRQLADNIVRCFKDAFNDPSLSEYARQQGIDVSDSLITRIRQPKYSVLDYCSCESSVSEALPSIRSLEN